MAARRRKSLIPGLSFSWKRALGVTSAKRHIAKVTGIPTTRHGRQAKLGRMMGCGGCLVSVLAMVGMIATVVVLVLA